MDTQKTQTQSKTSTYQLAYQLFGAGGVPVVLIHGIPTHSHLWQSVIPYLSRNYTVVAPDLLGYGQSPAAPAEELTLPRQAAHILALLDGLGINQAHFVGHDLGGGIAQILAVRHPDRVLSITLSDSVCFSNWPVPQVVAMRWPTAPEFEPSPLVVQEMLRLGVYNQAVLTPELIQAFVQPYLGPDGPQRLQQASLALEHHQTEEVVPDLGRIAVPTTVLWGQFDRFLPAYWGWRLHQAVPHSQLQILPGCGHFCMLDNPSLFAQHVLNALQRASANVGTSFPAPSVHPSSPSQPPA